MALTKSFSSKFVLSAVLMLLAGSMGLFAGTYTVTSPDGSIVATINETPAFQFSVTKGGKTVIANSTLGVTLSNMDLTTGIVFVSQATVPINETYKPLYGPRTDFVNRCNELKLALKNAANNQFSFVFRAYNEGIAFRYVIQGTGTATATSEATTFVIPTGMVTWRDPELGEYQGLWNYYSGATNGTAQYPVLGRTTDSIYVLMSEAGVHGTFCASNFQVTGLNYKVVYPGSPTVTLPLYMPWRYAMVGTIKNVFENTLQMAQNLNLPNELTDVSYIKAGRVSWSWLTERVSNYAQQKRYVDFAKTMGWEYCMVDEGWRSTSMATLAPYAKTQGVGIILWYAYSEMNTQAKIDAIMAEAKGFTNIVGMKVDFVMSDLQAAMKWYDMIITTAAAQKLMIFFHGCTVPRGQERRWPNYMTAEAVHGAEQYIGGASGVNPGHNCIIPYTRNAIASMDYTPVIFSMSRQTTKAHELAQSVVYYSSLTHFSDKPESYIAITPSVIQWLKDIQVTWDESRYLAGDPGNYCVVARRKGNDWWIAGINSATRTITLDLGFLKPGSYNVNMFTDSLSTGSQEMKMSAVTLTVPGTRPVMMATGGGFCFKVPNSYQTVAVAPLKQAVAVNAARAISVVRSAGGCTIRTNGQSGYLLSILDLSGKTVAQMAETGIGTYQLPNNAIKAGTYLIRAKKGDFSVVSRFVHK